MITFTTKYDMQTNKTEYIRLTVRDAKASARFYGELARFFEMAPECRDDAQYWAGGRTALTLAHGNVCFRTTNRKDVDQVYELVLKLGAKVIYPPQTGLWAPGCYSVAFEDPDGIRLEVNYVPGRDLHEQSVEGALVPIGQTRVR